MNILDGEVDFSMICSNIQPLQEVEDCSGSFKLRQRASVTWEEGWLGMAA